MRLLWLPCVKGAGKTVKGLYVNTVGDEPAGLFGSTGGPKIRNLTVDGCVIGNDWAGGILGFSTGGLIENCTNNASVTVANLGSESYAYVGGIAGLSYAKLIGCGNTGKITVKNITETANVGGIAGYQMFEITDCYNTGEISIGTNKWKTLLNNITFGLFFKDTQTITVTAADNSVEAVKIEYLLSLKKLTVKELAVSAFTVYALPFGIDPDNEYIIYVKLTDRAGNTDYICPDGTSPVIGGIENGKTYCAAQTVTITEKYVKSITVNRAEVTPDENNSFVLTAADGDRKNRGEYRVLAMRRLR